MEGKRRPDGTQPGDDRLMMESPEYWINWPILTLKKGRADGGLPDTGVLYDRSHHDIEDAADTSTRFRFLDNCLIVLVTLHQLRAAPVTNIDKLIEDGWVVD